MQVLAYTLTQSGWQYSGCTLTNRNMRQHARFSSLQTAVLRSQVPAYTLNQPERQYVDVARRYPNATLPLDFVKLVCSWMQVQIFCHNKKAVEWKALTCHARPAVSPYGGQNAVSLGSAIATIWPD